MYQLRTVNKPSNCQGNNDGSSDDDEAAEGVHFHLGMSMVPDD